MNRILAFSFFPAYVPPQTGGFLRLFCLYQALSRWHHITLISSAGTQEEEEYIQHGANFIERRIPKEPGFYEKYAQLDTISGGGDLSAPSIIASAHFPSRLHQVYLEEYPKADMIFHDSPFMVDYDLFLGCDDKMRIYNAYNCESKLYELLHPQKKSTPIHEIVHLAEKRILNHCDLVLYCNREDLDELRKFTQNSEFEACYAPNGMTPIATPHTPPSKKKKLRGVFIGSGHPPNSEAAKFITHTLAPKFPEIIFDCIGACLPKGSYPTNVKRYGIIDDATKNHVITNASFALNPMTIGSGSNLKIFEYFAHGLPIFSTRFGMRGIDAKAGKEYIEVSLENFVVILQQSLKKLDVLTNIGNAGKKMALSQYTWTSIAQAISKDIKRISKKKRAAHKKRVLVLNDYDSFVTHNGGGKRTQGICLAIREWSPVVFLCFSTNNTLKSYEFSKNIMTINVPKTSEHINEANYLDSKYYISTQDIISSRHCTKNPWLKAIYKILREDARSILIEHCYMAPLPISLGDRFVYSSHNNEAKLKNELLKYHPLKTSLLSDIENLERLTVERAAAMIAVSDEDAKDLIFGKRTAGATLVLPNGILMPEEKSKVKEVAHKLSKKIKPGAIVFVGSAHMPNVYAARFILEELAPYCSEVQFHIVGPVCNSILKRSANVCLWGEVDEITKDAILQNCAIGLNPIFSGGGSNIKIADYLSNGLFVITSPFGLRGYPKISHSHLLVTTLEREAYAKTIQAVLEDSALHSKEIRWSRSAHFQSQFCMQTMAKPLVTVLKSLEKPKQKILFVTYRYTMPALGGAEKYIECLIRALGKSNRFDIDVISPEVNQIYNHQRFGETYGFDPKISAPTNIPNVRFSYFPADTPPREEWEECLRHTWATQIQFEKILYSLLRKNTQETGITWGWAYLHDQVIRGGLWAFTECGIHMEDSSQVKLTVFTDRPVVTTVYQNDCIIGSPWEIHGRQSISFEIQAGDLVLATSSPKIEKDTRPLGLYVEAISINGKPYPLPGSTLLEKYFLTLEADKKIELLHQAAEMSRIPMNACLTDGRGPWSASLECFLEDHVADYDLVITHNTVFRPPVVALEIAKKHDVPTILIPHAHLDDDYYHFPDYLKSARNATCVLAAPHLAVDFFRTKGCNARYLPAGTDLTEQFTHNDKIAFQQVYKSSEPFVLILGQKSSAKGYFHVCSAIDELNKRGKKVRAVLIGADSDGLPLATPNADYLGFQPRNIVRGALLSCFALCNMSSSESFGIAILEAWQAGTPVIVNKFCAAFQDLITDQENGFLVDTDSISSAIEFLLENSESRERIVQNGTRAVAQFDWRMICDDFIDICSQNMSQH